MPNPNKKEEVGDSGEALNTRSEVEGSIGQRESVFSRLRELGELAQFMGDNEALDARNMTPEQRETQEEWVEASQREEAEDAFALMQAERVDIRTKNPLEILMAKETLNRNEEGFKN